mgnify:CR=1 FL=1
MRAEQTIDLGDGRLAVVRELRVRDVRRVLAMLTPAQLERPLPELMQQSVPELMRLMDDCLELPDGESIDDLSIQECQGIITVWWGLHRDFFLQAAPLLQSWGERVLQTQKTSTGPASDVSSTGTPASGTTGGAST